MNEDIEHERILARWTVDAADLGDLVRELRARPERKHLPSRLLREFEAGARGTGIEVELRRKVILVGKRRWSNMFDDFRVYDRWMHFLGDEGYQVVVPIARGAKKDAERVAATYRASVEQLNATAARERAEKRARPTLSNRLERVVEAHFAWVLLGIFFVLIPLIVFVLGTVLGFA